MRVTILYRMKKLTALLFSFVLLSGFLFFPTQAHAACSPTLANPMLSATKGTMKGTANLSWNMIPNANRYALVYGYANMPWMFGALYIDGGTQTNYMVTMLEPGKTYQYQVWAFCNNDEAPSMSNTVNLMTP